MSPHTGSAFAIRTAGAADAAGAGGGVDTAAGAAPDVAEARFAVLSAFIALRLDTHAIRHHSEREEPKALNEWSHSKGVEPATEVRREGEGEQSEQQSGRSPSEC